MMAMIRTPTSLRTDQRKRVIELTQDLGSGYWLDVHFIRGKTRRLFYPSRVSDDSDLEYALRFIISDLGQGEVIYTDDNRPVRVYLQGIAAIEVVEAVAPEASCDDTDSTETADYEKHK